MARFCKIAGKSAKLAMEYQPPALRPIMFVGTASDAGKSIITAGFCHLFKQDGFRPAPFKAQNMPLNSYVTSEACQWLRKKLQRHPVVFIHIYFISLPA
jgi:hypothetical protein